MRYSYTIAEEVRAKRERDAAAVAARKAEAITDIRAKISHLTRSSGTAPREPTPAEVAAADARRLQLRRLVEVRP